MALNVIDALVVTLGLDNRGFREGRAQTEADLKRVREQGKTTADQFESDGKRAANFFASLRVEVVGLLLALAGAKGIKDFAGQIITGDAAIGRFSRNLGVATDTVAAWQGAVTSVGGAASDADAALRTMADSYQNLIHLGTTGHDADLAGLGIGPADLKDPSAALLKLSEAAQKMPAGDFRWRAERLGISDSMITLLQKGRVNVSALVEEYRRLNHLTKADTDASEAFQAAMNELQKTINGQVQPKLTALLNGMTGIVKEAGSANMVLPVLNGLMLALAARTAVAAAPWLLLATAITEAITAYREWNHIHNLSPDEKAKLGERDAARGKKAWDQLKNGDFSGFVSTWWEGIKDRTGAPTPGAKGDTGSVPSGTAGQVRSFFQSHGYTAAQANGILASITAENRNLDPAARNPTSGAYGLGQWLSKNRIADFARVMGKPLQGSSVQDQLAFMLWEMRHTERGAGAAVSGSASSAAAAQAMIARFYRPGPGYAGDINRAMAFLGAGRSGASVRTSSTAQSVTIGKVEIFVPSGDPKTIARGLKGAIDNRMSAASANTGIGS